MPRWSPGTCAATSPTMRSTSSGLLFFYGVVLCVGALGLIGIKGPVPGVSEIAS